MLSLSLQTRLNKNSQLHRGQESMNQSTFYQRCIETDNPEWTRDSLRRWISETEALLSNADSQDKPRTPSDSMDNVNRLAAIIQIVDASALIQDISLSAADKSEIIATLYVEGVEEQLLPTEVRTDRLVWMAGS